MSQAEIDELDADELHRLTELYRLECERHNIATNWSDFHLWLQERDAE